MSLSPGFRQAIGIDWSGAKGPGLPGMAVARCDGHGRCDVVRPSGAPWRRSGVGEFIAGLEPGTIVGLDFAFSLPWPDAGPFPSGFVQPSDAFALWDAVDTICMGEPEFYAGPIYRPAGGHLAPYMFTKLTAAELWSGLDYRAARLRLTEQALTPSPNSVFKIVGAKTVGPGSFAGMRVLAHLRRQLGDRLRIWPFEPADRSKITLCEIYPTSFYKRAGFRRTKEASALAQIAEYYDARISAVIPTQDEADALVSAAALFALNEEARCFALPAEQTTLISREGWIFGVAPLT